MDEKLAAEKLYYVGIYGELIGLVAVKLRVEKNVLGTNAHSNGMSVNQGVLALVKQGTRHLVKVIYKLDVGGVKVYLHLGIFLVVLFALFSSFLHYYTAL